jgi:DNA polymerase III sliding clamp (beta) subunit (PCNA family)
MKTEIQLPAAELRVVLAGLNKVASKRAVLPVLQQVRLTRSDRGVVTLQTTNLDSYATYIAADFQPGPAIDVLVPLAALTKTVKGTKGEVVIVPDKRSVVIRSFVGTMPMEESFDTIAVAEWPPAPSVPEAKPLVLDNNLKATLQQAFECASEDESRPVIMGAHLDVSAKSGHYVVATNGRHLYSANSFTLALKDSLTIPTRKFLLSADFVNDGDWSVCVRPPEEKDPGYVQITSTHWRFITRLCDQKYPNWRNAVPEPAREVTRVDLAESSAATLLQLIPRLPGADMFNEPLTIKVQQGRVFVSGRVKFGKAPEIEIEGRVTGPKDNLVSLNREYFARALRFGLNRIEIEDELSIVRFVNGGRQIVVMPLRPEQAGPAPIAAAPPKTPINQSGAAAPPSAPPAENPTETERKDMSANTMTAPQRGNLQSHNGTNGEDNSAFKAVVEQIESIKTKLKETLNDLNQALTLIKAAEKEKRLNEKEMDSVRTTLRSLQKVQI